MRGLVLPVLLASLAATASRAQAAGSIEGTWSYGGGQVVVRASGPEEYSGIVVRELTATSCEHTTGEQIWAINDSEVADLYRGGQAFRSAPGCALAANRGFARWSVSADSAELCVVPPDDEESRPVCETITRLAAARSAVTFARAAVLPPNTRCRSRRLLRIRLRQPRGDAIVSARVTIPGRPPLNVPRGGVDLPIDLRDLPKGRYTVRVVLRTALKQTISGSRRYRSCG